MRRFVGQRGRAVLMGTCSVVMLLVLTACGGDAQPPGGGAQEPGGGATEPDDGEPAEPLEPLKIMTISALESPVYSAPWVETAIQVAVDDLNAQGGVDGRLIEFIPCNDQFDPNEAVACANRAVAQGVHAIVGGLTIHSASIAPILEEAQIPFIGPAGGSGPEESSMAPFYPINGGSVAFTIAAGQLAVSAGGPNVVVVPQDNATSRAGADNAVRGVEASGGTATIVVAPQGAPDYSSVAASVMRNDPDGVALTASAADAVRIVEALRQAGFQGPITGPASIATPDSIEALGDQAEGLIFAGRGVPAGYTDNDLVRQFNEQMRAADPEVNVDDIGLNAWLSVRVFAKAIEGRDISSGADVMEALENVDPPIDLGGIYADYPGLQATPPVPDYPRVAAFQVLAQVIENGQVVPSGDFFNPLEGE